MDRLAGLSFAHTKEGQEYQRKLGILYAKFREEESKALQEGTWSVEYEQEHSEQLDKKIAELERLYNATR